MTGRREKREGSRKKGGQRKGRVGRIRGQKKRKSKEKVLGLHPERNKA